MEKENNRAKNFNITFNTLRTYVTLYHTYWLLNCKGHIQISSNYSTIDVEKGNNRVKKMSMSHSIHLGFILYYISLTGY